MYQILNDLLSDKKGDIIFKVLWLHHLIYLAIFIIIFISIIFVLKNKEEKIKEKEVT